MKRAAASIQLAATAATAGLEAEPGVKGDTANGATKGATLQSGFSLQVPLFIKQGEFIKIDTRTGDYVERVNR